jgi:hypothetical protein
MSERYVYPHPFASTPVNRARVMSRDVADAFMRRQVAVRKDDQIFLVDEQLANDPRFDFYNFLHVTPWSVREQEAIARRSIRRRIARAIQRLRDAAQ